MSKRHPEVISHSKDLAVTQNTVNQLSDEIRQLRSELVYYYDMMFKFAIVSGAAIVVILATLIAMTVMPASSKNKHVMSSISIASPMSPPSGLLEHIMSMINTRIGHVHTQQYSDISISTTPQDGDDSCDRGNGIEELKPTRSPSSDQGSQTKKKVSFNRPHTRSLSVDHSNIPSSLRQMKTEAAAVAVAVARAGIVPQSTGLDQGELSPGWIQTKLKRRRRTKR